MFHMRQDNAARALVSPLLSRPSMTTAVSRMYAGGVAYKLEDRVQEAGAESMALQRSAGRSERERRELDGGRGGEGDIGGNRGGS
eukprot:765950-Hanusia_phi.AAC.3